MRDRLEAARSPRPLTCLLAVALSLGFAVAQDIEPRRWSHLPTHTDFLGLGYVYTAGDLRLDPASRIQDASVDMQTVLLSYNHYFDLFGQTARIDALLPWQQGRWQGLLDGTPASTSRDGLADPRLRLSVTFVGAPALQGQEFREYLSQHESRTLVGAAVAVRLPWGEYHEDRLINLGQNRYSIEPQLGVVHHSGPWSYEFTGSVFFYTDNKEFYVGRELEQDPLYFVQSHVVRSFDSGLWVSAGIAYGWAGESAINGAQLGDYRKNLQYGVSFGMPIDRSQAIRLAYIRGDTFTDAGMDSHSLLLSWSLRF
ncbi:MAG TPA: transporter [Planctomycetota bacterium]|nr:transporter [Planctomycetota bacterium]